MRQSSVLDSFRRADWDPHIVQTIHSLIDHACLSQGDMMAWVVKPERESHNYSLRMSVHYLLRLDVNQLTLITNADETWTLPVSLPTKVDGQSMLKLPPLMMPLSWHQLRITLQPRRKIRKPMGMRFEMAIRVSQNPQKLPVSKMTSDNSNSQRWTYMLRELSVLRGLNETGSTTLATGLRGPSMCTASSSLLAASLATIS